MKRDLTKAMEARLLRKHTSGDCGAGKWETIESLLKRGMLEAVAGKLVVTAKGRAYCDEYHTVMPLR